ncbi:MAG: rod shape-determining protein MreD [Eubacteriales bacterium]|nr:rod shape-determining protein MreD [Eubacteriales bacterium]
MKRIMLYMLLILTAFITQTCIFPLMPLFSAKPNLLLILTFSFGFMYGCNTGMLCGLFSGLLMDLFYTGPFGFYSLIFVYIGYINGLFSRYYYDDFITLPLILCTGSELIYNLYIYVLRFLLRAKLDIGYYFFNIILPEIVFSVIITLIIYRLLLKLNKKLDKLQDRRGQNVA